MRIAAMGMTQCRGSKASKARKIHIPTAGNLKQAGYDSAAVNSF